VQQPPPSPWIGIDGRSLILEQGTGVSSYGHGLSEAVRQLGYQREVLLDRPLQADGSLPSYGTSGRGLSRLLRWSRALSPFERQARIAPGPVGVTGFERIRRSADIFRVAQVHFDIYRRPLGLSDRSPPTAMHWTYPMPAVLRGAVNIYTIHDLIPQTAPELKSSARARQRALLKGVLSVADHIITVSETSRRAIIDEFDYPPDKVTNTYQPGRLSGAGLITLEEASLPGLTRRGFYLAVGTIEKRKNIGRLIQAYLASGVRSPLVLAGPEGWQAEAELAPAKGYRIGIDKSAGDGPGILSLGYLPAETIRALLQNARGLLFPSLSEGFGLPIVEAMAVGTPVMTSRGGATGEVADDAALLVDPLNVTDMAAGIAALENNYPLWLSFADRGMHRARYFSAERYVERLADLYRHLRLPAPGL
jgi:glycosyltransferase involved in cell wall biosynthesis